jgi:hypothetical protein
MTMREVAFSVNHIQEEIKSEKIFIAGLHDKKINFPEINTETAVSELTEAQRIAIENDRKNFFKDM